VKLAPSEVSRDNVQVVIARKYINFAGLQCRASRPPSSTIRQIKFVPLSAKDRFTALQSGELMYFAQYNLDVVP